MLAVVAALVLAQSAPPPSANATRQGGVVVMVTRREGLSALEAAQLAERMADALATANLPLAATPGQVTRELGEGMALGCRGNARCLAGLTRQLGAGAAVGIEAAKIFGELALQLVVVDAKGTAPLLERTTVLPPEKLSDLDRELAAFAREAEPVLRKLPALSPPPALADAPRNLTLTPSQPAATSPAVTTAATSAKKGPPVAAYVLGGGAAASGVVAGVFGAMAYSTYTKYGEGTPAGDALERDISRTDFNTMNRNWRIAGVSAGVTAALISGAVYFLVNR